VNCQFGACYPSKRRPHVIGKPSEGQKVKPAPKIHRANARRPRTAHAYATTNTALPDAGPRSQWKEITPFSAADEVLAVPELKAVIKTAIERGFAIVPESKAKAK
jgi:hypothetical protein